MSEDYTFVIALVKVYREILLIFTIAQDTYFSSCSFSFLFDKINIDTALVQFFYPDLSWAKN